MSEQQVRMIVLSTDNLEESIKFYTETLGFPLKFRDGAHFAALDGGSVTLALATAIDHPIPGQVVVGIKTDDVDGAARAIDLARSPVGWPLPGAKSAVNYLRVIQLRGNIGGTTPPAGR